MIKPRWLRKAIAITLMSLFITGTFYFVLQMLSGFHIIKLWSFIFSLAIFLLSLFGFALE